MGADTGHPRAGQPADAAAENAVAEAQKSLDLTPNFALGYFALGVARVFLGRFDEASDPFGRAKRLWERTNPYVDPTHHAHVTDGLRKAGWSA